MIKSVKLEWALDELARAMELLEEGLKDFADCAKLWMMKGQIFEQQNLLDEARDTYFQ